MTPGPDREVPVTKGHGDAKGRGVADEADEAEGPGVEGETVDVDAGIAEEADGLSDPDIVDPEIVDPEIVDPEIVDADIVDAEVVDEAHAGVAEETLEGRTMEGADLYGTPATAKAVGAEQVEEDIFEALSAARREREEYLDALRRMQADFDNYRKRVTRQQQDVQARAAESLVQELLPSLDAFDLAIEHLTGDEEVSPGGLLQAAALLRDTLEKQGLERTGAVGEPFDPTAHEAVEHIEEPAGTATGATAGAPGGAERDRSGPTVDAVFRTGFKWKGRVVRPAMVRVRG